MTAEPASSPYRADLGRVEREVGELRSRFETHRDDLATVKAKVGAMDRMAQQLDAIGGHVAQLAIQGAEERGKIGAAIEQVRGDVVRVENRVADAVNGLRQDLGKHVETVGKKLDAVTALEPRINSIEGPVRGVTRLVTAAVTMIALFLVAGLMWVLVDAGLSPPGVVQHLPAPPTKARP
jgi:ABC-type transporter Mla subunit MlaD